MRRARDLLDAAISYSNYDSETYDVPPKFESVAEAVRVMRDVLLTDARAAMSTPLPQRPDNLCFHALDMQSSDPGIVCATSPRVESLRMSHDDDARATAPPAAALLAETLPPAALEPSTSADDALRAHASARADRIAQAEKAAVEHARRDRRAAKQRERAAALKDARAQESAEDRTARLQKQRDARKERQQRRATEGAEEDGATDRGSASDVGADAASHAATQSAAREEAAARVARASLELDDETSAHVVLPPRTRRVHGIGKSLVFASPIPLVRHITALASARPHPSLEDAVLRGTPSPNVTIVSGPPGTGKTRHIVDFLTTAAYSRALVCAPSNVAAAGIYARILASPVGDDASICLPRERMPDGPVASTDPARRIVCATVSGRSGALLRAQSFDAVVVDEAAQCTEACLWGLLRPEVTRLVLVGDEKQLPAVTADATARERMHGRSLMERLVGLGYPCTRLTVQHRMHPEISAFPSRYFYDGSLVDAPCTHERVGDGAAPPLVAIVVAGTEDRRGSSVFNAAEADAAAAAARRMPADAAVILCPYRAQCLEVLTRKPGVPVHTIDSFQGRECDHVVLCMCRTGAECGFWSDGRRLNVALTRARKQLVVLGSFDWTAPPLCDLARDVRARGCVQALDSGAPVGVRQGAATPSSP